MKTPIILLSIILLISITSCCKKTTEVFIDTVATPVFSPEPYLYNMPIEVWITCATPGAEIRYTTEGYYTNENSHLYTGPIQIDSTTTIKAVAFKRGMNHSELATGNFISYSGWNMGYEITRMQAEPDTIYGSGENSSSVISVTVRDMENFAVSRQLVEFHTSLGNISETAITDSAGVARATLLATGDFGIARVTATVKRYHPEYPEFIIIADTASVDVTIQTPPPEPVSVHSLQFTQSGTIDLNVVNTGGFDAAILRVKLYDADGNLFTEPRNVWFRLLSPGSTGGANLNNSNPADSVLAVSNNGMAQVTLYSGTLPVNLIVKASCTDNGRYRETVKDNIVVHAGPAYRIEVFGGGYNTGENLGGGMWRIVVGARLYDLYDNPVSYGTSVWFQIPDNEYNCQIGASAYVGNQSMYGDSTEGTAYTNLIYNGIYSGQEVEISAVSMGYNGLEVYGYGVIVLPLNGPRLEVLMTPGNLVFRGNTNPTPPSAMAVPLAGVYDSQGCPVRYADIILTSTRGVFEYTTGTNTDPDHYNPADSPDVIITDANGLAEGLMRFYAYEVPYADPMMGSATIVEVTVTGYLFGLNISANTSILLIRYPT